MNIWESPTFVEVDMSAEIGGYQGEQGEEFDSDNPDRMPDFADNAVSHAKASHA